MAESSGPSSPTTKATASPKKTTRIISALSRRRSLKRVLGSIDPLRDLIEQIAQRHVELVGRFVGAALNLRFERGDAVFANFGKFAGLSDEIGFGRNVQLIDSSEGADVAGALRRSHPMRSVNRLGGVNLVRSVN